MFEFTQSQITSIIILLACLYLGNIICLFNIRYNLFFGHHCFNSFFWKYIILSQIHATILGLLVSNCNWQIGLLFFFGAFFVNILIIIPSIISMLNMKYNIEHYRDYKKNQLWNIKHKQEQEHLDIEKGSDLND